MFGPVVLERLHRQTGNVGRAAVVPGQVTEKFREAVKAQAEQKQIPICQFQHKERKDDIANGFRRRRGVRDQKNS